MSDRGKSRPINPPPPAGALAAVLAGAAGVLAGAAAVVAAGADDVVGAAAALDVALAVLDFFELHAAASRTDTAITALT
ncbi:MAG TPA: hypothetical protein VIJ96_16350 [Acidothermaceae bacterium]